MLTTTGKATNPTQEFIEASRLFLKDDFLPKAKHCLEAMSEQDVWWRPNEQSNSVGNLLMHLAGNIRQWVVSGVGGAPSTRDRAAEFAATSGVGTAGLLATLDQALDDVDAVLASLSAADLLTTRTIQGRELSVLEAVYHVVEHFSLHLGQIIFIAKLHAPGGVRFYEDAGGLARPLWPELRNRT